MTAERSEAKLRFFLADSIKCDSFFQHFTVQSLVFTVEEDKIPQPEVSSLSGYFTFLCGVLMIGFSVKTYVSV